MQKIKDIIAVFTALSTLVSFVFGNVVPPALRQEITPWQWVFFLCLIYLLGWSVDRYIITPIKEATAALRELQRSAAELGTVIGQQSNTVGALDGKISTTYEYIRQCLVDIQQRISPAKKRD